MLQDTAGQTQQGDGSGYGAAGMGAGTGAAAGGAAAASQVSPPHFLMLMLTLNHLRSTSSLRAALLMVTFLLFSCTPSRIQGLLSSYGYKLCQQK